jgi:nicotinate-nucleotide adenylyltransferase
MVRLAVADDAQFAVDDAEINRKGLSFTVDTLEHLAERNPGAAKFFLLLGEDALAGFEQWRNPARIRELATLAAMRREGMGSAIEKVAAGVLTISTRRVDVSSTEIRKRLRDGKSIKGFVPESVDRFIEARGLYR